MPRALLVALRLSLTASADQSIHTPIPLEVSLLATDAGSARARWCAG